MTRCYRCSVCPGEPCILTVPDDADGTVHEPVNCPVDCYCDPEWLYPDPDCHDGPVPE